MFEKLIPDSLSLLHLAFKVSSWVTCYETTDSPQHSEKQILEVLCSDTWVMHSLTLELFLYFVASISCEEGVASCQAGTPVSSGSADSLSVWNWFT